MPDEVRLRDIETPAGPGSPWLGPTLSGAAAWLGVRLIVRPLRLGSTVIAARHRHVREVLARDLDFRIGPVNAARIDEVNGPFILGMDRSADLTRERHALYAALAEVDMAGLAAAAGDDADQLLAAAGAGSIDAVAGYARIVAGRTAARLCGIEGSSEALFLEVARAVFAHTFLNLGGDAAIESRAVAAAGLLRGWLSAEIAARRASGDLGGDLMGALMRRGELDDDAVRRQLGGMLVGAVDTTAAAAAKILVVAGRDRGLARRMAADAGDPARLWGWCLEALRRWPHNPLVLRQAAEDTTLDGAPVPAGSRVFAWTQAAMLDPEAFPDPGQSQPDRPAEAYLHFGGGLHPCAGRAVNAWQVPLLVGRLVARGLRRVGPIAWAGPFPAHLPLELERP